MVDSSSKHRDQQIVANEIEPPIGASLHFRNGERTTATIVAITPSWAATSFRNTERNDPVLIECNELGAIPILRSYKRGLLSLLEFAGSDRLKIELGYLLKQMSLAKQAALVDVNRLTNKPVLGSIKLTREDNQELACEITEASATSMSLRTHTVPPVGERLCLGNKFWTVSRNFVDGIEAIASNPN
jgi:hypothetical protein